MKRLLLVAGVALCTPAVAHAQITQLLFDSFLNMELIGDYYSGGLAGGGTGPGPNYGVTFGTNAHALTSVNAGGTGSFQGNPSGNGVMYWSSGSSTYMNVANGFSGGFSLYYSSLLGSGSVTVWDGLNGTGNALAMIDLPAFPSGEGSAACPAQGSYCPWVPVGTDFAGTALSISFEGVANYIAFDNVTFGSANPSVGVVPEPGTVALMATGLLVLAGYGRRRRARLTA